MKYMNIFLWGYFVDDLAFHCVSPICVLEEGFSVFSRSVKKKMYLNVPCVETESLDNLNYYNMTPFHWPFTVLCWIYVLWRWFVFRLMTRLQNSKAFLFIEHSSVLLPLITAIQGFDIVLFTSKYTSESVNNIFTHLNLILWLHSARVFNLF